jgi:peroxiredoxin
VSTSDHIAQSDHPPPRAAPRRLPAAIGLVLLLCLPAIFVVRIYQAKNLHFLGPGDPVPALTARDLTSNQIRHFIFKDTSAALLFFSADCPHCQREIANFDRLSKRFGDRIVFLAISTSDKRRTSDLINSDRLQINTLLDEGKIGQEGFGVDVVPALFLIGNDGTIAYSGSGEKTFAAREQLLMEFTHSIRSPRN